MELAAAPMRFLCRIPFICCFLCSSLAFSFPFPFLFFSFSFPFLFFFLCSSFFVLPYRLLSVGLPFPFLLRSFSLLPFQSGSARIPAPTRYPVTKIAHPPRVTQGCHDLAVGASSSTPRWPPESPKARNPPAQREAGRVAGRNREVVFFWAVTRQKTCFSVDLDLHVTG